jgi:hypothetical protein
LHFVLDFSPPRMLGFLSLCTSFVFRSRGLFAKRFCASLPMHELNRIDIAVARTIGHNF